MRKRLDVATKNLAFEDPLLPATDQNEIGNAINRKIKAIKPRETTGSKESLFN